MSSELNECPDAYENPSCPYVTEINKNSQSIKIMVEDNKDIKHAMERVSRALLGDDGTGMKEGIIFEITGIKNQMCVRNSWINFARPIVLSIASALIGGGLTYFFAHP